MQHTLSSEQMQHCLKVANTIGREVNEEINEVFNNAVEGTVVKVMVAELMLLNLKTGFIAINNKDGEFAFNELHSKIKNAIYYSPDRGNSGRKGNESGH